MGLIDHDFATLVIGAGSIGRRHIRNLRSLGIRNISVYDPDTSRLAQVAESLGAKPFVDFKKAMNTVRPNLVFVCSPPVFHVLQALEAVKANAHVFVEKPLSHALVDVDKLIAEAKVRQRVVQVGYNFHFHPGLQKIKQLLDKGVIGRILWARAEMGQYLPDWRPWQDYRQSYTARQDLGGGIILDSSHELDYIIWFLGQPTEVMCMAGKVSNLDVNVEDNATILLRFANGSQADIHVDFVQRGYNRFCKLVGEQGTIMWNYSTNQVRIYHVDGDFWETISYVFESNDMYVAEEQHFLECVDHSIVPEVSLQQAKKVLEVALAAKSSAEQSCGRVYL